MNKHRYYGDTASASRFDSVEKKNDFSPKIAVGTNGSAHTPKPVQGLEVFKEKEHVSKKGTQQSSGYILVIRAEAC